jgi:hypothetical protein
MADKKNGPAGSQPGKKPMTKMEGVRRTLRELGKNAMPLQIQDHLKKQFGIDMTVAHISNYKSEILRKKKGKGKRGRKAAAMIPAEAKASAPVSAPGKGTGGFSLEDIQTTKALVGRIGADRLRTLIDVLAK